MPDADKLILIAVGPDHVGLVQKISEFIVNRGGNIEDSRMAVLAGEFAQIVLVSGDADKLAGIASAVETLSGATGLSIWTKRPSGKKSIEPSIPYRLVASCMDHPGIVHRLSTALSERSINIESLETQTYAAPISGTPIFRMEAVITVPARININQLRAEFETMETAENINIDLDIITSA